jgi:hypothetical protein
MKFALILLFGLAWSQPGRGQELRLAREIGSATGPAEYTFGRIASIAVDADRNIYVLDVADRAVRVFDSSGRFIRMFGREGSGPGEFQVPLRLGLAADTLTVFDARLSRISRFTRTGRHLSTEPLPSPAGLHLSETRSLRHNLQLGVTIFRGSPRTAEHDPFVRALLTRAGSSRVDTLATYQSDAVIWSDADSPARWGVAPSRLGQGGAIAVSGDSLIALVDGDTGIVRWMIAAVEGVRTVSIARLDLRGTPVDSEDRRVLEDRLRTNNSNLPRRVELVLPPRWSGVTGQAFFDDEDQLWVELNHQDPGDRHWMRISLHGQTSRTIVPQQFNLMAAAGGRLYGVWLGDLEVQTVRVYELR